MRLLHLLSSLLLLAGSAAFGAEDPTPKPISLRSALKLLPKGQAQWLARAEAREGTPDPHRWHLLVYNPDAESGVHEYVIAGGAVVASRELSQFARQLTSNDVIGADSSKLDSDQVAKVLQQYALVNQIHPVSLNYSLKRGGANAAPVWQITALDAAGEELASLVIIAAKGTVIAHDGFTLEPASPAQQKKPEGFTVESVNQINDAKKPAAPAAKNRSSDSDDEPHFFRRVGHDLKNIFTGKRFSR